MQVKNFSIKLRGIKEKSPPAFGHLQTRKEKKISKTI